MARVTDEDVREYQSLVAQLFQAVIDTLKAVLTPSQMSNPELRQEVAKTTSEYFSYFGRAASDLGRAWYQHCRDTQSDGATSYVAREYFDDDLFRRLTNDIYSTLDRAQLPETDKDYLTEDEALDRVAETAANYVQKVNRDTVVENINIENEGLESAPGTPTRVEQRRELRRMKNGRVAFMRVPSAGCTCAFCIMMASRGAVYKTLESAGGGDDANKYHLHCRCSVVPVSTSDPIIDGYSTEEYEDAYYDARAVWQNKSYSDDVKKRIERGKAEAAKNDRDWRDINEIEIVMRDMFEMH